MTLVKPHIPTFEVTRHTGESWEDCEHRAMVEVHRRVQDAVRARGWPVDPDSGENLDYKAEIWRKQVFVGTACEAVGCRVRWIDG